MILASCSLLLVCLDALPSRAQGLPTVLGGGGFGTGQGAGIAPGLGFGAGSGTGRGAGGSGAQNAEPPQKGVRFSAKDSITFTFGDVDTGTLFGYSTVSHTKGNLTAGQITLHLSRNEFEAKALTPDDSLSFPVLRRAGEDQELKSRRILFNYDTGRGKFEAAQVTVSDGTLIGGKVKNASESVVFIEEGRYSTCPPSHMTYYIQAEKLKVVDEEEIFFTNARLFILDIPYPIPLPFGYVPASMDQRRSGLLQPTYVFQNTSQRGLGLRNLGWFQIFNDYLVGQASFDVFTSGSFFHESRLQYRVTDRYDGDLSVGYSREQGLESTDLDFSTTVNRRISVRHNQPFSPYASLSANVNLNTSDYFRRNSYDIDERASTSSTSRIAYIYRDPENRFNLSVSSSLNQQYTTQTTSLSGPSATFSARTFSPFAARSRQGNPGRGSRAGGLGAGTGSGTGNGGGLGAPSSTATGNLSGTGPKSAFQEWAEKILVSYKSDFTSRYSYRPLADSLVTGNWLTALFDRQQYEQVTGDDRHYEYGLRQNVSVTIGQILPGRNITTTGSFQLRELWVPSTIRKRVDEDGKLVTERVSGFAAARDGAASVSMNTTLYGIADVPFGQIERLRHTLRPSIGLSYQPDFTTPFWGGFRSVQAEGAASAITYSIFEQSLFGSTGQGDQFNLTYALSNILEAKRVQRDSTGEVRSRNVRIIDNLALSGAYNLAADSLRFSTISLRMNSRALKNLNLQFSATYDLYGRDEAGRRINTYIWQQSGMILQPLNVRLSASTTLKGGSRGARFTPPPYQPYDPFEQSYFHPIDPEFLTGPLYDLSSPWSVGFNFNYSWTWRYGQEARRSAVLNATNIRFNLSPLWSVSTRLGYDFIERELTPSQFNLNRQMICWNLSFQFNPFGDFQYYFFRLSLDSGQIQNLFQKLPGLNNLERSSSPTGAGFRR